VVVIRALRGSVGWYRNGASDYSNDPESRFHFPGARRGNARLADIEDDGLAVHPEDRPVERGVVLGPMRVCYDLERGEEPREWGPVVFRDPAGRVRRANLVVTNRRLVFSCRRTHAIDLVAIAHIEHHARFGREWFTIDIYDEPPTSFSGRRRRMRRLTGALPPRPRRTVSGGPDAARPPAPAPAVPIGSQRA
jgi:hypothetical protein